MKNIFALVIVFCMMTSQAQSATSSPSSAAMFSAMMGAMTGSSSSANGRANSMAMSSEICGERSFAVIRCDADDDNTGGVTLFNQCDADGHKSFNLVAESVTLKNPTVSNIIFDSYNRDFYITVCHDGDK